MDNRVAETHDKNIRDGFLGCSAHFACLLLGSMVFVSYQWSYIIFNRIKLPNRAFKQPKTKQKQKRTTVGIR